jgi:hypothetical protein
MTTVTWSRRRGFPGGLTGKIAPVSEGNGIDPEAVAARRDMVEQRLARARDRSERATQRALEAERAAAAEVDGARADRLRQEARLHQQAAAFHATAVQELAEAVRLFGRHLEIDLVVREAGSMLAVPRAEIRALLSDEMAHSRRIGDGAAQQHAELVTRIEPGQSSSTP